MNCVRICRVGFGLFLSPFIQEQKSLYFSASLSKVNGGKQKGGWFPDDLGTKANSVYVELTLYVSHLNKIRFLIKVFV